MTFHINPANGVVSRCRAEQGNCPFGGHDGTENHYESIPEARRGFEAMMAKETLPPTAQKKAEAAPTPTTEAAPVESSKPMGLADLNKAVKTTEDPAVFADALERGSSRTFGNMLANPALPSEVLAEAYGKTEDARLRERMAEHKNFPASALSVEDFGKIVSREPWYSPRVRRLWESDAIGDEHLAVAQGKVPREAFINPNNRVTAEGAKAFGIQSWSNMGLATAGNKFPAEAIKDLDENVVYWGNVYQNRNPAYLQGYADWVATHPDSPKAAAVAGDLARNEHTPTETLDFLAKQGHALPAIYRNPRTSAATKALIASSDPEVGRIAKIEALDQRFPDGGLKGQIVKQNSTDKPFGVNRGYSVTRVQFDMDKVRELGLNSDDIHTLMNSRQYNAGVRFDEKSGVFEGQVDSTD